MIDSMPNFEMLPVILYIIAFLLGQHNDNGHADIRK